MPTVVSQGTLTDATFWSDWKRPGGMQLAERWMDYAAIYRTQPNVRAMVDFLARNHAQLGLHVFRRVGENDRLRLRDHQLAQLLERPNYWTTRHRLIYSAVVDRNIYGQAFWLKMRLDEQIALLRVPPQLVTVKGGLVPTHYTVNLGVRDPLELDPDQIVHFRNHNPDSPIIGLSTLESLRAILDEDLMAIDNRKGLWSNAGRQPVIIKRPIAAGKWTQQVADRFNESFTVAFRDPKSSKTPLLEDDMQLELLSFNSEQSQYTEARKLTMQQVATAFNVSLSMAGLDGAPATFASVKEFHKMLYTETLGPSIDELESDIALQLLPEFEDTDGVYVEFNIMEKLQGSFEEQAEMLQKLIGRPIMTMNEGRARLNLPARDDGDDVAVPLNIDPTGEGTVTDSATVSAVADRTLARQRAVIGKRLAAGFGSVADAWDRSRWDRELAADLVEAGVAQPLAEAQRINAEHRTLLTAEYEGRSS